MPDYGYCRICIINRSDPGGPVVVAVVVVMVVVAVYHCLGICAGIVLSA